MSLSVFDPINTYNRALYKRASYDTATTHGVLVLDHEGFYHPARLVGKAIAHDHVDIITNEVVVPAGTVMNMVHATELCSIGYSVIPCLNVN